MEYFLLFLAIASEVFATTMLKYADGFTKIIPSALCVIGYIFCYFCFGKAVQKINLAVAYAIWCGVGIIATAFTSYFLFHEKISAVGYLGMALIGLGCVLMNVFGGVSSQT
ncbi:MAG: multidrug efflux SMR transporter [Eubacteriales bacterium]|jgi:small multidrug resistance pump